MNLLLADDERSIRNYLRTLVDWESHGYTLLEAENGQAAIDIIEQQNVNLLLMDISMPVMSGLDALQKLRSCSKECVVTLLTCHDEFEYAQAALKLGCFDYVLKSDISAENILGIVDKMKNALSTELRQRQNEEELTAAALNRKRQELQSAFGYWLQSGSAPQASMSSYLSKMLDVNASEMRYASISLELKDYAKVINRYTASNPTRFTEVLDGVMRELLADYSFIYVQLQNGIYFILLWFDKSSSAPETMAALHNITQQIDINFHTVLDIEVRIIYSLPFWGVEKCRDLYLSVCKLNELLFFGDGETVSCVQDYNFDAQNENEILRELQQSLTAELYSRNLASIENVVVNIAKQVRSRHVFLRAEDFVAVCKRCVTEWLTADSCALVDWDEWNSPTDINALVAAIGKTIAPHCLTENSSDKKNVVKKAILIIQQCFSEQISLESIATQLFVNPSYLSHLFSEEMNQPITSYINSYRIEQAKKLMTSSNFKLYEIARKSGFSSHIVFSTCFKKITGETPTEYKNKLL